MPKAKTKRAKPCFYVRLSVEKLIKRVARVGHSFFIANINISYVRQRTVPCLTLLKINMALLVDF